jgi:transcriptional regulator with XRE-family HTH domain
MAHPVDEYVGKRVRLRRILMGMSQEALGLAVGVTFQQVQKYERGINRIGCSRLYQFSQRLGTPISFFFDGFDNDNGSDIEYPKAPASQLLRVAESAMPAFEYEQMSSRETLEMMRAFNRISDPQVRKRVFDLVRALADEQEIITK